MTAGPVNDNEFSGTSRTRYFMDPETTYEWNIRSRVLNSDGSTDCVNLHGQRLLVLHCLPVLI